jgi:hypothetical protein
MDLLEQIPGLEAAIAHETRVRAVSFLAFPEVICGIDVPPMTLRHYLLLAALGSPFINGGRVEPYDVAAFFICVTGKNQGVAKWRLLRQIAQLKANEALDGIESYLAESFQDAPAETRNESQTSYFSFAAGLVDLFASQYGWAQAEIVDSKLKCLFQYLKAAQKRANPKSVLFNPSDKLKGRWLADVNAGRIQLQN